MAATSSVEYVKVTGLKETTSVADVVAYFESERFGGGTVSVVVFHGPYNARAVVGLSNVDSNALSKATHRIGDAKVRVVSHATPPTEDERTEAAYIAGKTVPAKASDKLGATQGTECRTAVKESSSDSLPQNVEEATLPVSIFESASTSSNHPTGSNTGPEEAGTIIMSTIAPGEGTDIYFECKELGEPISEENLKSLFSEDNLHLLTGDWVGRFDVVHVDVKEIIGEESYVVKLTIRVDEVETLDDLRSALHGTHQCQGGEVDIKKCSKETKRRYNAQCAPETNTTTELTKTDNNAGDHEQHYSDGRSPNAAVTSPSSPTLPTSSPSLTNLPKPNPEPQYILVTCLTPSMSTEDIVSYFQSYRCGAGTVTEMVFTDDSRSAALLGISRIELNDSHKMFQGGHRIGKRKVKVSLSEATPTREQREHNRVFPDAVMPERECAERLHTPPPPALPKPVDMDRLLNSFEATNVFEGKMFVLAQGQHIGYILVTGLTPSMSTEDIVSYFQSYRCGAGRVTVMVFAVDSRSAALLGISGIVLNDSCRLFSGVHTVQGAKLSVDRCTKVPASVRKDCVVYSYSAPQPDMTAEETGRNFSSEALTQNQQRFVKGQSTPLKQEVDRADVPTFSEESILNQLSAGAIAIASPDDSRQRSDFSTPLSGSTDFATGSKPGSIRSELSSSFPPLVDDVPVNSSPLLSRDDEPPTYIIVNGLMSSVSLQDLVTHLESPRYGTGTVTVVIYLHNQKTALVGMTGLHHTSGPKLLTTRAHYIQKVKLYVKMAERPPTPHQLKNAAFKKAATLKVALERPSQSSDRQQSPASHWPDWNDGDAVNSFSSPKKPTAMPPLEHDSSPNQPKRATLQAGTTSSAPEGRLDTRNVYVSVVDDESIARAGATVHPPGQGGPTSRGPPPGFVRSNIPSGSVYFTYDPSPGLVLPSMPSGSSQSIYEPSSSFITPTMPAELSSQPNNIPHSEQQITAVVEQAHEAQRKSQPMPEMEVFEYSSHPKSNILSAGARDVTVQSSSSGAEKPKSESVSSPVSQRPVTASMRSVVVRNLPRDWDKMTTDAAFDNPDFGGGKISSQCKDVITFEDVTVAARLIKQGRFNIGEHSLEILPYHPPRDPLESVLRERGLTTDNTLVFDKVPAHIRNDHIKMYLENTCSLTYDDEDGDFELIRSKDKDLPMLFVLKDRAKGILSQCLESVKTKRRALDSDSNTFLSAVCLEPITTLVVKNIGKDCYKDSFLEVYFGNKYKSGGGKVKQVSLLGNDTAAVYFEDPEVVLNVLASLPLHMEKLGYDVSLRMHHPILTPHFLPSSTHVPGSDTPVFKHQVIELPISAVMAELFENSSSHVSYFSGQLQSDSCATAYLKPKARPPAISISPCSGSEYIKDWTRQCRGKFKVFMEEFHEESLSVPHPVGGQVYSVILTSAKSTDVHVKVSSDNAGGKCILAGKKQPVDSLLQTVRTIIRQNHTKMGDIPLGHDILVYIDKSIREKLQVDHPKIAFKLNIKKGTLHASGTEETYDDFVKAVNSLNPVVVVANLEEEVVSLLAKDIGFLQSRLPRNKKVSFYFIGPDGSPSCDGLSTVSKLHFVSDSRQQALDVIKSLKASVAVDHFKVPSEMFNLLFSPQWTKTFRNLESQFQIHITPYREKMCLSVACDKIHLDLIRKSLQEFVEKECFIRADITMEEGEWEYLEAYSKDWKRLEIEMEKVSESIKLITPDQISSGGRPCITLHGEKTPVTELSGKIRSLIAGIERAKKEISRPGIAKHFLSTAGKHQLAGVGTANRAVVKVTTQDEQCKEESAVQSSSPHRLLCSGSIAGRMVEIRNGDLTEFPVDVIVNAANEQLNHSGGIAGIISQKGGPSIQKDSTEHVERSGSLSVGDAVLRPAVGTLPCKAIVHAVGPRWRDGQSNEEALLVKAIRESLKAAEKYKSIGFPAISAGIFGMPVRISARAMLKGIKEYFSDVEATLLTNVTIMLFDEKTIPDFITSAQNTLQNVTVKQNTSASTPHRTAADVEYDYRPTSQKASVFERHGSASSRINVPPAVQLKKGSLTDFTADVYVNTAHTALDLNHGAVAQSLLKAGGTQLQKECTDFVQQHGRVPDWGHAVTRGGNLQCRHVIHAVGSNYSHGQSAEKGMSTMISNIMAECDRLRATSVAFPAIGTGALGFPDEVVAKVMLQSIANYYSTHHGCRIKQVLLVVFMDKTHKAFKAKIEGHQNPSHPRAKSRSVPGPHVSSRTIATEEAVHFPETDQSQDMVSSSFNSATLESFTSDNVAIDIIHGDLTNEECDGLVSTSSTDLQLQPFGVMGALLKKGGPELQHECSIAAAQHGNLSGSKVIVTGVGRPGGLTCTRILHVQAPNYSGQLCNVVTAVLKKANEQKLSVVAFPAIGTGVHGFTPEESARGICEAIVEFSKSNPTCVSQIKVVLFQKEHYTSFASAFSNAGNQVGLIKRAWNFTKNLLNIPSGTSKQPSATSVHRPVRSNTVPIGIKEDTVLSIRVYAGDKKSAQLVMSAVEDMVKENYVQYLKESDYVGKLSVEVKRMLQQEAKDRHVVLTFDPAPLNAIHLKGNPSDCSEILLLVEEELKKLESDDRKRKHAEDLVSKVQWQWLKDDKFQDYDPMSNFQIEEAYQAGKHSVDLSTPEGPVKVDIRALKEIQKSPPFSTVDIKRLDLDEERKLGEHPPTWDPMPLDPSTNNEVACHLVDLPPHSPEYQEVKQAFEATMAQGAHVPGTSRVSNGIKKIERVQNRKLWVQYSARKKTMDKDNPSSTVNEKKLFHGCASSAVPSINHTGFNRSYAGLNATIYGKGMYFARDAIFSARYSIDDPTQLQSPLRSFKPSTLTANQDYTMYLARVLTGQFTKGSESMVEPPPKNPARPNVLFDSVIDKSANPTIFVVFFDAQAYPEYLITFHA